MYTSDPGGQCQIEEEVPTASSLSPSPYEFLIKYDPTKPREEHIISDFYPDFSTHQALPFMAIEDSELPEVFKHIEDNTSDPRVRVRQAVGINGLKSPVFSKVEDTENVEELQILSDEMIRVGYKLQKKELTESLDEQHHFDNSKYSLLPYHRENLDFDRPTNKSDPYYFPKIYTMDDHDHTYLKYYNKQTSTVTDNPIDIALFELSMTYLETEWNLLENKIPIRPKVLPEELDLNMISETGVVPNYGSDEANDIDQRCSICFESETFESNSIIYCDSCNIAVHQDCYGVSYIPLGHWFCRRCAIHKSKPIRCEFCPSTTGAFKQLSNGLWSHVICALWIPETYFASSGHMEPIEGIDLIPKGRWRLVCYICKVRTGAPIQCINKNCYQAFHVTCARRVGLYMGMNNGVQSALQDKTSMKSYCHIHSPNNWNPESTKAYFSKALQDKKLSKIHSHSWTTSKGTPILPDFFIKKLSVFLQYLKVSPSESLKLALVMSKYWVLKREMKYGMPLIDLAQNALCFPGESTELREMISFNNVLVKDLENLENLGLSITKRFFNRNEAFNSEDQIIDFEFFAANKIALSVMNKISNIQGFDLVSSLCSDSQTSLVQIWEFAKNGYFTSIEQFFNTLQVHLDIINNSENLDVKDSINRIFSDVLIGFKRELIKVDMDIFGSIFTQPEIQEVQVSKGESDINLSMSSANGSLVESPVDHTDMKTNSSQEDSHTSTSKSEIGSKSKSVPESKSETEPEPQATNPGLETQSESYTEVETEPQVVKHRPKPEHEIGTEAVPEAKAKTSSHLELEQEPELEEMNSTIDLEEDLTDLEDLIVPPVPPQAVNLVRFKLTSKNLTIITPLKNIISELQTGTNIRKGHCSHCDKDMLRRPRKSKLALTKGMVICNSCDNYERTYGIQRPLHRIDKFGNIRSKKAQAEYERSQPQQENLSSDETTNKPSNCQHCKVILDNSGVFSKLPNRRHLLICSRCRKYEGRTGRPRPLDQLDQNGYLIRKQKKASGIICTNCGSQKQLDKECSTSKNGGFLCGQCMSKEILRLAKKCYHCKLDLSNYKSFSKLKGKEDQILCTKCISYEMKFHKERPLKFSIEENRRLSRQSRRHFNNISEQNEKVEQQQHGKLPTSQHIVCSNCNLTKATDESWQISTTNHNKGELLCNNCDNYEKLHKKSRPSYLPTPLTPLISQPPPLETFSKSIHQDTSQPIQESEDKSSKQSQTTVKPPKLFKIRCNQDAPLICDNCQATKSSSWRLTYATADKRWCSACVQFYDKWKRLRVPSLLRKGSAARRKMDNELEPTSVEAFVDSTKSESLEVQDSCNFDHSVDHSTGNNEFRVRERSSSFLSTLNTEPVKSPVPKTKTQEPRKRKVESITKELVFKRKKSLPSLSSDSSKVAVAVFEPVTEFDLQNGHTVGRDDEQATTEGSIFVEVDQQEKLICCVSELKENIHTATFNDNQTSDFLSASSNKEENQDIDKEIMTRNHNHKDGNATPNKKVLRKDMKLDKGQKSERMIWEDSKSRNDNETAKNGSIRKPQRVENSAECETFIANDFVENGITSREETVEPLESIDDLNNVQSDCNLDVSKPVVNGDHQTDLYNFSKHIKQKTELKKKEIFREIKEKEVQMDQNVVKFHKNQRRSEIKPNKHFLEEDREEHSDSEVEVLTTTHKSQLQTSKRSGRRIRKVHNEGYVDFARKKRNVNSSIIIEKKEKGKEIEDDIGSKLVKTEMLENAMQQEEKENLISCNLEVEDEEAVELSD